MNTFVQVIIILDKLILEKVFGCIMKNIPGIVVILVLLVLAVFMALYWVLKVLQKEALQQITDPFVLVPSDATMVYHSKSPVIFLESLIKTGPMAKDLGWIITRRDAVSELKVLDSLLQKEENLYHLWRESSVVISRHPATVSETSHFLFNIRLPQNIKESMLHDFLQPSPSPDVHPYIYQSYEIFTSNIQEKDIKYHYTLAGNLLVISSSPQLIEKSLLGLQNNESILSIKAFEQLRNVSGLFADNLYWNTESICHILDEYAEYQWPLMVDCMSLNGWQAWDISYNAGHLIFNGFISPSKNQQNITVLLEHQSTFHTNIWEHIPFYLPMFFYMGIDDVEIFSRQINLLKNNPEWQRTYKEREMRFQDITTVSPDSIHLLWKGELAWLPTDPYDYHEQVILLKVGEKNNLLKHPDLGIFFKEVNKPTNEDIVPQIWQNTIPGFISLVTHGFVTRNFDYFTFSGPYLLAANSSETLTGYMEKLRFGHHIGTNPSMKQLQTHLHNSQNILLHYSIPSLLSSMKEHNTQDLFNNHFKDSDVLNHFGQLSIQFLPSPGSLVFSNMLLVHQPDYTVGKPIKWETQLKSPIHKGPYKVFNHNDQSSEMIVQDVSNHLYLINLNSKILWEKEISGPIMSDIYQVDIYKNNRYQYLFNTRNYLHLIDRNGNYVRGYPMRLPFPASAGIAVFDYDKNKNYRIIFPSENKRIYNYNLGRKPVSGWQYNRSKNLVSKPLQHIRLSGKDFLFVTDNMGNLEILNRRGLSRINPRQSLKVNPSTQVFANTTQQEPHFMIAGDYGELNQVKLDGTITRFRPDSLSPDYSFIYANLTGDNEMEMIYLDKGILSAYHLNNRPLFTLPVSHSKALTPGVIDLDEKGSFIGVYDEPNKLIFLINDQGEFEYPFPVPGGRFFYFDFDSEKNLLLITGVQNTIMCYNIDLQSLTGSY